MTKLLTDQGMDLLFRQARTHNGWQQKPVTEVTLRALHDLMRLPPTSMNCSPARVIFVTTDAARARLIPALSDGNRAKTQAAPVTAIIGHDLEFWRKLPELAPHNPNAAKSFSANRPKADETAFRNGSLQGAYLILAARALGLDCGPMSGFDAEMVNDEFFAGTTVRVNFLCNLGYGDAEALRPRAPRPDFDDVCSII